MENNFNKEENAFLLLKSRQHFLQCCIINKHHNKLKKKKKKKKEKEFFKKGLGTRGIGLVLLRFLSKKKNINQNFQFLEKI